MKHSCRPARLASVAQANKTARLAWAKPVKVPAAQLLEGRRRGCWPGAGAIALRLRPRQQRPAEVEGISADHNVGRQGARVATT